MKAYAITLETLTAGNVRATGRVFGRTVARCEGATENAKALIDEVMALTCGPLRIGNRYDLTYISVSPEAVRFLD